MYVLHNKNIPFHNSLTITFYSTQVLLFIYLFIYLFIDCYIFTGQLMGGGGGGEGILIFFYLQ